MIIDISHHQDPNKINYDILAKQVSFVIIRTQYGSKQIDKHFKTHHKQFQKRGVPTAAYAFVRGKSIHDMEQEAFDFYNRTKQLKPTFWFLDVEESSMKDMRAGVKAYGKKLRSLGAEKIGVYIAHHLYKKFRIDISDFDAVWIPHYGKNDGTINSKPSFPCDLHQYTDRCTLPGYNGFLDLNHIVSDKNLAYFIEKSPSNTTQNREGESSYYTIKRGDTLSHIAKRFNTTVDELTKLNEIQNPHKIYAGETLMIPNGQTNNIYYTVKRGDTLSFIAYKFGTTVKKLVELNNIYNPHIIFPGQKLRIK